MSILLIQGWAYDPNLSGQKKNDFYARWKCRVFSRFLLPKEKRTGRPRLLLAATSNHENECWWQREGSEKTWVLVDIIELLMAFCLEPSLLLVFQLKSLQIFLLFNPLWVGVTVTAHTSSSFPLKTWQKILLFSQGWFHSYCPTAEDLWICIWFCNYLWELSLTI